MRMHWGAIILLSWVDSKDGAREAGQGPCASRGREHLVLQEQSDA